MWRTLVMVAILLVVLQATVNASASAGTAVGTCLLQGSKSRTRVEMGAGLLEVDSSKEMKLPVPGGNLSALEAWVENEMLNVKTGQQQPDVLSEAMKYIRGYIFDMKNDSNTSHGIDQKEINGTLQVIASCDEKTPNNDVNLTRMKHSECRFKEIEKLADETVKCTKYEGNRTTYPYPPTCSLKKVRTTDPQEKKKFEACMDEFGKWFGIYALYKPCKEATEAHQNQKAQCHQLQSNFEDSSCDYREDGKSYCKCRTTHIGLYDSFCKGIRQKEAARKADYEAAERIDCLFKVWETGASSDNETGTSKNTTLSKCKMMTVDTQHLTIDYGSIPVADLTCGPINQVCDSNWLKEEYNSQAWYSKAPTGTCTPCPTPAPTPVPTPAPTPAPPLMLDPSTNKLIAMGLTFTCILGRKGHVQCFGNKSALPEILFEHMEHALAFLWPA